MLDTARSYAESEQVIGPWLAQRDVRERLVLLTKGGHGQRHGGTEGDFAVTIEAELGTSLEVLGVEQVDLYLLHRDSPAFDVGTIVEALNRALRRGRVRVLGASNWEYDRIERANAYARDRGLQGFSVVSNHLALARPAEPFWPGLVGVGADGRRWHRETGVPLLVFSAQARGFFSGRYGPPQRAAAAGALDPYDARMLEVYGSDANFARPAARPGEGRLLRHPGCPGLAAAPAAAADSDHRPTQPRGAGCLVRGAGAAAHPRGDSLAGVGIRSLSTPGLSVKSAILEECLSLRYTMCSSILFSGSAANCKVGRNDSAAAMSEIVLNVKFRPPPNT